MTRVGLYALFAAMLTCCAVAFFRGGDDGPALLAGVLALWTVGAMLWTHDRVRRGRPRGAAWTLALCLVVFAVLLGWCGHRLVHGPGEFRVTLRVEQIDGRCQ
jgi:hypothetical protein